MRHLTHVNHLYVHGPHIFSTVLGWAHAIVGTHFLLMSKQNKQTLSLPLFLSFSSLPPPTCCPPKISNVRELLCGRIKRLEILTLPMARAMCPWAICYYYRQKLCIALG